MDLNKLKEPFPQDRISWRAQTVTKAGDKALALAYIDARDVMERLDEVCGPANWQCRYSHADKKTICDLGICTDNGWVWKADGAGDSDIEAEKGALSDAFKRSAVRWGIGRYLYDLETPWVPCESREYNGKRQFVKFTDDPWKHVRHGPKGTSPPKPEPAKKPSVDGWLEEQRRTLSAIKAYEEYTLWQQANEKPLAKLANDYPDKYEALTVFIDGLRDNWTSPF
jgi:hypothetical protein